MYRVVSNIKTRMSQLTEVVESLNLPKQILDKSESLMKTLFGNSFDELGGMITDQVKYRRFNAQLSIIEKAERRLKEKKINPKSVSLKVLAPLIEFISYEEDPSLQEKWANLTANILQIDNDTLFQQNSISTLNKLSNDEISILEGLYDLFVIKREERHTRECKLNEKALRIDGSKKQNPNIEDYALRIFNFSITKDKSSINFEKDDKYFEYCIHNLINLGVLRWYIAVNVSAQKMNTNPEDMEIGVFTDVYDSNSFYFTKFGEKFVKICSNK
jgi:hypothetical protein